MNSQKIRLLAQMGLCTASLFIGQVALAVLPNIEIVSLLVILFTLLYGKNVFFIIYSFVILAGFLYGFGIWWINYLYVWSILAILTMFCKENTSNVFWAILSGFFGLAFGGLCTLPYLVLSGTKAAFAYWVAGLGFDILHCLGNFFVCLVLFRPLYKLFSHIIPSTTYWK